MNEEPVEVFNASSGGGYDWAELRVYRHPQQSDRFAIFWDSGCSCNYFSDPTIEELKAQAPLLISEVQRKIQEWLGENHFWFDNGLDIIERWRTTMKEMA